MSDEKKKLRDRYRRVRSAIPSDIAAAAARLLARHVTREIDISPGAVVAGYWPFPDELDPRPLMDDLAKSGHPLSLPVVVERGAALQFRAWALGEPLIASFYGTQVPAPDAPILTPDVLLVPLLAYDDDGYRLGYGGGYYDRTLAGFAERSPISVGLAFAQQKAARVPRDEFDRRLDWIATENGVRHVA